MATYVAFPYPNQTHLPSPSPFVNVPPSSPADASASARRPKLSINTQCAPSIGTGKKSTGLRLDTLSTTSPTARNTFKNAFDVPSTPQASTAPFSNSPFSPSQTLSSSSANSSGSSSASLSSLDSTPASSVTTPDSEPETPKIPYSAAQSVRSILTNSPLGKRTTPRGCMRSPQRSQGSDTPSKKVGFRQPLSEDIQTSIYLLAHSDLRSRSASPEPVSSNEDVQTGDCPLVKDEQGQEDAVKVDDEEEIEDQYPKTPLAGRRKRRREWVWTLGPNNDQEGGQQDPDSEEELASPTKRAAPPSLEFSKIGSDVPFRLRAGAEDFDGVTERPGPLRITEVE